MFYITKRYSACVDCIAVDPFNKIAKVRYNNGSEYTYSNVSRRSIINLMSNKTMSLGFWINKIKRDKKVTYQETGFNVSSNALLAS